MKTFAAYRALLIILSGVVAISISSLAQSRTPSKSHTYCIAEDEVDQNYAPAQFWRGSPKSYGFAESGKCFNGHGSAQNCTVRKSPYASFVHYLSKRF
jgi:hypothetical protein